MADASRINLTNQFLIAMPGMADGTFTGAVVYMCEHNEKGALGLVAIADQVGMSMLAQAATAVAICAERRDGPALAATLSRLMRISDCSLTAVWDTADLSG